MVSVQAKVMRLETGVLGMHMLDGTTEKAERRAHRGSTRVWRVLEPFFELKLHRVLRIAEFHTASCRASPNSRPLDKLANHKKVS